MIKVRYSKYSKNWCFLLATTIDYSYSDYFDPKNCTCKLINFLVCTLQCECTKNQILYLLSTWKNILKSMILKPPWPNWYKNSKSKGFIRVFMYSAWYISLPMTQSRYILMVCSSIGMQAHTIRSVLFLGHIFLWHLNVSC